MKRFFRFVFFTCMMIFFLIFAAAAVFMGFDVYLYQEGSKWFPLTLIGCITVLFSLLCTLCMIEALSE